MPETINGKFRRVKRVKRGEKVHTGKVETLGDFTPMNPQNDPFPESRVDIPLGVQAWEYLHQGEVQTESVILTGSNNPSAMEENVFYRMEQDVRYGADVAAEAAQRALNEAQKYGITGITGVVILGLIYLFFVRK